MNICFIAHTGAVGGVGWPCLVPSWGADGGGWGNGDGIPLGLLVSSPASITKLLVNYKWINTLKNAIYRRQINCMKVQTSNQVYKGEY